MSDPLLSSLCGICHIYVPKYTCPRCSQRICSLPCSRRHKIWASCNGVRDPTVYMPKSQLASPSGIDHDYNFLHSIEHRIERSEKEIVEERNLVGKEELTRARTGHDVSRIRPHENKGEACIERELVRMRTRVVRAPKGMTRYLENGTNWSRSQRCIHWQVEWVQGLGGERVLSKVIDKRILAAAYSELLEDERRRNMTGEEKKTEKKRKADETRERQAKKAKLETHRTYDLTTPILQDPDTGRWNLTSTRHLALTSTRNQLVQDSSFHLFSQYHFYLHRPYTPASLPKVLIPLYQQQSLSEALSKQVVLEYPTIYVLACGPEELPEDFMTEEQFLASTNHQAHYLKEEAKDEGEEDGSTKEDINSSASGWDSDESMEEGEIG